MTDQRTQLVILLESAMTALQSAITMLGSRTMLSQQPLKDLDEKEQQPISLQYLSSGATDISQLVDKKGDLVGGDKVAGNKIGGDSVQGDKHEHIYASLETPDQETLLIEYLDAVIAKCNRLSLADADNSDPMRAAIELAAVYTRLEVASPDRPRIATDAVATHKRLVLLGEPGSGKSAFVNFLCLCLSHATLGHDGWLEKLGSRWPKNVKVPIRVVLPEFATWLAARDHRPNRADARPLWDWLALEHGGELVGLLRKILRDGSALLMLDGLDEIPSDVEEQSLNLIQQMIDSISNPSGPVRILVTCRTLDYQYSQRNFTLWPNERLIPFSEPLRNEFIERWYDELARLRRPLSKEPVVLANQLKTELRTRTDLRRLAGNPLLLTLMTLLHAYEGRLPDERVKLYEKCVELLLHRWRTQPEVTTLRDQLGIEQWSDRDLRRLLDRLGFVAHERGVAHDGESGTNLPKDVVIETARLFFAPYDPNQDVTRAQTFCNYISRYSNGLLQQSSPDMYYFPHRTFQEYLAAHRLVADDWDVENSDFVERALRLSNTGLQWREVLLLAVSQQIVTFNQIRWAIDLTEALLEQDAIDILGWGRNVILAGEVLAEIGHEQSSRFGLRLEAGRNKSSEMLPETGREQTSRLGSRQEATRNKTIVVLMTVLEQLDATERALLPLAERLRAGQALGVLGDPRFPVTIEMWIDALIRRNERFGIPDGYWCYVEPGLYTIGGWEAREQTARIQLPKFWIARFPVTVEQFLRFVREGYEESGQRWWTSNGWEWRNRQGAARSWMVDDLQYRGANQPITGVTWYEAASFTEWLTENLQDILPEGYIVRLPTEAEWEVAAAYDANGERHSYPWGDTEPSRDNAIYNSSQLYAPAAVGCCPTGLAACGALDLVGNIWEMTTSSFASYPMHSNDRKHDFTQEDQDLPWRGGGWSFNRTSIHCGARTWIQPNFSDNFGFRVVIGLR